MELQQIINESSNIVFFGGAGVSTESGIPDFRSVDGLYNQRFEYPPEEILSHTFFVNHTEYFYDFDYILGDYAYNKLRLKGFCEKNNSRFNKINDIKTKDNYLKELCAFNCNYFLIKKEKRSK